MFDRSSTFGHALDTAAARAVLETYLPGIAASPMAGQFRDARLGQLLALAPTLREDADAQAGFWAALAEVPDDGGGAHRDHAPAIDPDPDYEGEEVPRGSAGLIVPDAAVPRWGVVELRLDGPSHGNPFVDVEVGAVVTNGERSFEIGGFYDGDGTYLIRFLAEEEGEWRFETASTARSLDGISGAVQVGPAASDAHGPVRIDGHHFAYADGTRYRPVGTTAYAWTHQAERAAGATRSRPSPRRRSTRSACASSRSRTSTTRTSPSGSRSRGRSPTDSTRRASTPSSGVRSSSASPTCSGWASRPTSSSPTPTTAGASPISARPPTIGYVALRRRRGSRR